MAAVLLLLSEGCTAVFLYQVRSHFRALERDMYLAGAALANDLESAKRLLEEGANPNYLDCWTSLEAAVQNNNLPMVKLLLDHGADVRQVNSSGPILAQVRESDAVFNLLLERGADVNARASYARHETVLMQAVREPNADNVKRLLTHGVNPYPKNDLGETVFDIVPNTGIYNNKDQAEIFSLLREAAQQSRSPKTA